MGRDGLGQYGKLGGRCVDKSSDLFDIRRCCRLRVATDKCGNATLTINLVENTRNELPLQRRAQRSSRYQKGQAYEGDCRFISDQSLSQVEPERCSYTNLVRRQVATHSYRKFHHKESQNSVLSQHVVIAPTFVKSQIVNMSKTPIFLTGATGYIGGAVLERLLAHPSVGTFDITALVRSPEKAKLLETFGVKPVVGSLTELDKLAALAEQAHVVFECADSDDLPAMEAILKGIKKRHATTGDVPIFIHTSGSGVLTDNAKGMYATDTIYSDLNVEQIESLPPTAYHRNVDLTIVQADKEGYAKTYIVLPGTIYGIASGPLFDAQISNRHSMQIPALIKASLARKQGAMVGLGKAIWPSVYIDDAADLYIVLFNSILANPDTTGHGREGFYFAENGEHTWYDISKTVSKVLAEHGIGTDEPTTFSTEELIKYFGSEDFGNYGGTNSRCRADRSRSIGWKPTKTKADMLASIKPEVEAILQRQSDV
ncbi:Uncharacterized protein C2A9.02 [Grifola frondosa]|uniref:Uncharacterized protein C2A9.02 n=1 Tax=Grifola frondosa TaxID=5627 RepID=A0A1C7M6N4_GRIFR|nr:Uncharacterized protein C2A9.02 [Grifola frondosa]